MKPDLIIFDFDGTLADTTATILATYRMTIEETGAERRTDLQCQATIGLPLREGFARLFPDFTDAELDICVNTYRRIFDDNKRKLVPRLFPGVKETLDKLAERDICMTIASSRSRESLMEFCRDCGIVNYFSLILGADDVSKAKPDPQPVLLTMDKLNFSPARTFVVGDMPVDIAMGNGAGCTTVGVTYGNSSLPDLIKAGATHVIDTFPDLIRKVIL